MRELEAEHGLSQAADDLLGRMYSTEHEVSEEMAAWFAQVKTTGKEKHSPPVVGVISSFWFKLAKDEIYSPPLTIYYTRG